MNLLARIKNEAQEALGHLANEESDAVGKVRRGLAVIEGLAGKQLPSLVHGAVNLVDELRGLYHDRDDLASGAIKIGKIVNGEFQELKHLDISGLVPAMRNIGMTLVNTANLIDPPAADNSSN